MSTEAAIRDQADALDRYGEAVGIVAREVAEVKDSLARIECKLDTIIGQGQSFGKRLTAVEVDVDALKAAELVRAAGTNGNGEART